MLFQGGVRTSLRSTLQETVSHLTEGDALEAILFKYFLQPEMENDCLCLEEGCLNHDLCSTACLTWKISVKAAPTFKYPSVCPLWIAFLCFQPRPC